MNYNYSHFSAGRLPLLLLLFMALACKTPPTVFEKKSTPQLLFSEGKLTEGPAVDAEGNLYFSDQPNDMVRSLSTEGRITEVLQPSGVANGMAFDHEGRLLMCQSNSGNYPDDPSAGKRRVVRMEKDRSITILADAYNGKKLIGPNDLCVDKKGNIYFTDPYFPDQDMEKSQPVSGVYRIDVSGKITRIISDLLVPNGIIITPDNQTLYVSDRGTQKLHRYQLQNSGQVHYAGVVYMFSDRGIDGMALDSLGRIYGAAGRGSTTGVYVIDPEVHKLLDFQPLPATAYNLCFGGKNGKVLYICAGGNVYAMRTQTAGVVLP